MDKNEQTLFPELPLSAVSAFQCLPLRRENGMLVLGSRQEPRREEREELEFICGCSVIFELVDELTWSRLASQAVPGDTPVMKSKSGDLFSLHIKDTNEQSEENDDGDGDTVNLVHEIVSDAIYSRASDIHFEPYESYFRVRYRIDGVLQEVKKIALSKKATTISRLKIMAEMDIAEKRRPQDGRISVSNGERTVDIRVSTLPTHFGEKVVLRLLDKSSARFSLDTIGMTQSELEDLRNTIFLPYGIILVTGPTGSGKSTTLYSMLQELNDQHRNIVTIEDPIEYDLPGINQAHARPDIGFSFAQALRSFLRQDPDVIMVGEIRDRETAEMAFRAALTGHLVLSTLHTNDAPGTIMRLMDMGIEPFLIGAATRMIIAQRLVRLLCPRCKREIDPSAVQKIPGLGLWDENGKLYEHFGCESCRYTGFKGRTALFESLQIDNSVVELINSGASADKLRAYARENGMKILRDQGLELIRQGRTTVAEVLRETSI
jgi:type II secretory ATPase GspE/PulE/Tfp pilus assembly ATPase PilB-like protein